MWRQAQGTGRASLNCLVGREGQEGLSSSHSWGLAWVARQEVHA